MHLIIVEDLAIDRDKLVELLRHYCSGGWCHYICSGQCGAEDA